MIEVKDIVKSFDGNVVLNHVSTELRDGEVNMIIGQSGSGKTVLMKSLIGLHPIDSGQILYDGTDIAVMRGKDIRMLHRQVGMLFQGSALFDSMTVMENVLFPMEMFSTKSRAEMRKPQWLPFKTSNQAPNKTMRSTIRRHAPMFVTL